MRKFGVFLIFIVFFGINNSCELLFPEPTGQIVFWSDYFGPGINIYFEDEYKGTISTFFDAAPECGSLGNVTLTLAPGIYTNWHAEETGYPFRNWNKDHTHETLIQEDGCLGMRLYATGKTTGIESGTYNGKAEMIGEKSEN